MPRVRLEPAKSVVVLIDVQEALLAAIHEVDRVVARSQFLLKMARLLEVPILATEQNPTRMGGTEPSLAALAGQPIPKMAFSACGCDPFLEELGRTGRRQVVLVGVETHICVSQTAHDLLERGYDVVVCPDAVSARSLERHKLGMERLRDAGVVPAHTESVAYEWLRTAEHPCWRDALKIVKEATH